MRHCPARNSCVIVSHMLGKRSVTAVRTMSRQSLAGAGPVHATAAAEQSAGSSGEDLERVPALANGFRPLLHLVGHQVDVGVQRLVVRADDAFSLRGLSLGFPLLAECGGAR